MSTRFDLRACAIKRNEPEWTRANRQQRRRDEAAARQQERNARTDEEQLRLICTKRPGASAREVRRLTRGDDALAMFYETRFARGRANAAVLGGGR